MVKHSLFNGAIVASLPSDFSLTRQKRGYYEFENTDKSYYVVFSMYDKDDFSSHYTTHSLAREYFEMDTLQILSSSTENIFNTWACYHRGTYADGSNTLFDYTTVLVNGKKYYLLIRAISTQRNDASAIFDNIVSSLDFRQSQLDLFRQSLENSTWWLIGFFLLLLIGAFAHTDEATLKSSLRFGLRLMIFVAPIVVLMFWPYGWLVVSMHMLLYYIALVFSNYTGTYLTYE